ncbi:Zinc finger protein bud20 [Penicillium riverlandense]|uniref:Zinc finger protein bud20 n=1 Tax=Penicillium riverlandense TaxID=1903569 RepID=UPI002549AF1E|nr:Zinc finger protein bud20 [Penicillium riverlandense]KAJ5814659.1 Zinc finger protein bud20 [Penicillium riverlandense]
MGALRRVKNKRRTRHSYDTHSLQQGLRPGPRRPRLPRHLAQYKATKDAEDLPGLGRHFCVECSKWFESEYNLKAHTKGKNHKRRLRLLREEPHSQKIAEAAVGQGIIDNGKRAEDTPVAMEE